MALPEMLICMLLLACIVLGVSLGTSFIYVGSQLLSRSIDLLLGLDVPPKGHSL